MNTTRLLFHLMVLCSLAALFGCAATPAEAPAASDGVLRLPVSEEDLDQTSETWFGIYQTGHGKVGWARSRSFRSTSTLYPSLVVENARRVRLGDGRDTITVEKLEFSVSEPHALIRLAYTEGDPAGGPTLELEQRGGRALVAQGQGTEARVEEREALDYTFGDAHTLGNWLASERQPGDTLRFQEIDTQRLITGEARYVVRDRAPLRVDGVDVIAYELEYQGLGEGVVSWLRADSAGNIHHVALGPIELRRESKEQATRGNATLDLRTAIPVQPALGDRLAGDSLTLVLENAGALIIPEHPGQRVRPDATTGEPLLVLERVPPGPIPADVALILGKPRGELRELLAPVERENTRKQVRQLLDIVNETLERRLIPGTLEISEILDRRAGDCTEHARLFQALASALGVRCREVTGLFYTGDEHGTFARHTWCEVAIGEEWWSVDPTTGALPTGLGYIYLGHRGGSTVLTVPEDLRFRVLE